MTRWYVFFSPRDRPLTFAQFDPGRNRHAAPGQTDILDDEADNNDVEPYTYGQNAASPQMSQFNAGYPVSNGGLAPSLPPINSMATSTAIAGAAPLVSRGSHSEASGGAGVTRGPSSASTLTSAGFAGRGAQPQPGQMPFSQYYQQAGPTGAGSTPGMGMPVPVPTGQPQQQQPPMSAAAQRKAREAAGERHALRPVNPSDGYYASGAPLTGTTSSPGSSQPVSPGGTSGVVVHSDGGRYVPDESDETPEGPSELPPQ
jgi:hypothetical protein